MSRYSTITTGNVRSVQERVSRSLRHLRCVLYIAVAILVGAPHARAQKPQELEYRLKAAFIYNFLQFIEWPADAFSDANAPLVIGTLGGNSFKGAFSNVIEGETIGGRKVVRRHIVSIEEAKSCHLLFIPRGESDVIGEYLEGLDGSHVLLVSEVDGFSEQGGAINFYLENNKLRFEINIDALRKAQLTASSKLLRLAKIIPSRPPGGE